MVIVGVGMTWALWIFMIMLQLVNGLLRYVVLIYIIHEPFHRTVEAKSVRDLVIQVIGKHQPILFLERVHIYTSVPTGNQLPFKFAGLFVNCA